MREKTSLTFESTARSEMIDITTRVREVVSASGLTAGRIRIYVPHTTAGVTVNEHADPSVAADILAFLDRLVPWEANWRHAEGNSAAHIKSSLVGCTATVGIGGGNLELGTWQGIFLCEFDGPRRRSVWVTLEE